MLYCFLLADVSDKLSDISQWKTMLHIILLTVCQTSTNEKQYNMYEKMRARMGISVLKNWLPKSSAFGFVKYYIKGNKLLTSAISMRQAQLFFLKKEDILWNSITVLNCWYIQISRDITEFLPQVIRMNTISMMICFDLLIIFHWCHLPIYDMSTLLAFNISEFKSIHVLILILRSSMVKNIS